jgi:hypothetical protein
MKTPSVVVAIRNPSVAANESTVTFEPGSREEKEDKRD